MTPNHTRFPTKAIASCFSLAAFSIAIIAGLGAQRSAASILITALAALFICHILGAVAASVIEVAIREHIKRYQALKPIPTADPGVAHPALSTQPDQTD